MRQIREGGFGKRIVAEVLNSGDAVCITVSFPQLRGCERRESADQNWDDLGKTPTSSLSEIL